MSSGPASALPVAFEHWGLVPYDEALRRQLALHEARVEGRIPDTLVTVEHPATATLGRHAPAGDVLWQADRLEASGIRVVRSDRGGRATYHGPGQIVCYPIVAIAERGWGAKRWVEVLEEALIEMLRTFDLVGERICGRPGIWVGGAKIASLGLRIARGVSYHGLALNTRLDPSVFDCIVTCGVATERVTTLERECGETPPDEEVRSRLLEALLRNLREHSTTCPAQAATRKN